MIKRVTRPDTICRAAVALLFALALGGALSLVSCGSSKTAAAGNAPVVIEDEETTESDSAPSAEQTVPESDDAKKAAAKKEKPAPKKLTKQEKAEAKRLEKEAKQKQKEDEKRRKRERTDPYLGVVYTPESNCEFKRGKIRIVLRKNTSSFNIYAIDENNRETLLFSPADDSSTSFFSVLIGKHEYRLNRAASVSSQLRLREDGVQIAYTVEKKLQIVIDFTTLASVVGGTEDLVKVTVYTTNLTESRQTVAIRAVLDTILGENFDYHFLSASGIKIDTERQFSAFKDEPYFISTNGKVTAQFLLNGKTIQTPQTVSFANADVLANSLWTPVVKDTKPFHTALSYNNSAVCINWPYFSVERGETNNFSFYIAVGTEGDTPKGAEFIDSLADDTRLQQTVTSSQTEVLVKRPDVDFVVAPITDDQLDPEYIQNLIDRINSLSSDPALVDRTELRQLNAELDAILERIRQLQQQ